MTTQEQVTALTSAGVQVPFGTTDQQVADMYAAKFGQQQQQQSTIPNTTREMAFAGVGLGIIDIPFANYTLVGYAGRSANGKGKMRTAKYANPTGGIVQFYGIDTYPHLWDTNNELKTTVAFKFEAEGKKLHEADL
jgi:hypothetical protein